MRGRTRYNDVMRPLVLALLALIALPASASAIVGGETTDRDFPHMAAMEYRESGEEAWDLRCGGSLIRPDVVLTAAHCVDAEDGGTLPAERFRFLLGTKRRSADGERLMATQIVEHPAWDDTDGRSGDVALVKLERDSEQGRPIALASDGSRWEPGDIAVVTGWGTEFYGSPTVPDDLKEAEVPIVSDDDCETSYRFTLGFDPETNVCAGNLIGGEDSCQGDSGGPLQVASGDGWQLVGVVSYGLGCAFPTQYGVYAEAAGGLRGWIEDHADDLTEQPDAAPSAPATAPAPAAAAPSESSSTAAAVVLPTRARLGLKRGLRVGRRMAIRLDTTRPLRSIVLTLKRGRRTLAVGRRARLGSAAGTVLLKRRRGITAGRAVLTLRAVDETGRRVLVSRRVRVR